MYDYSIGDKSVWKSKFRNVIRDITYFNVDDIAYEYYVVNCWFYLEDNKFKQYMISNILHILKFNNHKFYNEIEYYLHG